MQAAVIGGGVIGASAALELQRRGAAVTLIERDWTGTPASGGNAGILAMPEITPLARPGTLRRVPGWLLDPLGPLHLRWRDLPQLTGWLWRFLASATPAQVERATRAMAGLMASALADHAARLDRLGRPDLLRRTGALYLYDDERSLAADAEEWALRAAHGYSSRVLTPAETRGLAPALEGPFAAARHSPDYAMVGSPARVLALLREALAEGGAGRLVAEVTAIEPGPQGIALKSADGALGTFDRVVVAAGVWSRRLLRPLGLSVALETERGYNTTLPDAGLSLPCPVFFAAHGFVATPLDEGLRIGGAVELARVEAPPDYRRADAMLARARRYLPALAGRAGVRWMGCRPSTPDSLPVIGLVPGEPRLALAFGHGHLGLTLSATTGRLTADLVEGRPPGLDLAPFRPDRFA